MVAELLRVFGNEVAVAFDGQEAISFFRQELPSVVLLDIGLPGMDGYTVARTLRADAAVGSFTLIALTGYGSKSDIDQALEAGFTLHLSKPIAFDTLIDAARQAIRR